MKVISNILDGFRLALTAEKADGTFSPVYEVSSLVLGRENIVLSATGKRWGTFVAQMELFASGNMIPVIEFPANKDDADTFSSVISLVEDIIIRQTGMESNVSIGLKYMIDECTDNIIEHSHSKYGYISSCVNKDHGFVDVCIADRGITILGSYKANNDKDIISDLEAMQAANRGISTKNRPNAENRGYGLMTTKKMIVTGLGGVFAMISGVTIFVYDEKGRRFLDAAEGMKVSGTIIVLRIPYINQSFKYIDYIE